MGRWLDKIKEPPEPEPPKLTEAPKTEDLPPSVGFVSRGKAHISKKRNTGRHRPPPPNLEGEKLLSPLETLDPEPDDDRVRCCDCKQLRVDYHGDSICRVNDRVQHTTILHRCDDYQERSWSDQPATAAISILEALGSICEPLEVTPDEVIEFLQPEALNAYETGTANLRFLAGHARWLSERKQRRNGIIPARYTVPVDCANCGPVMLPHGPAKTSSCVWCHDRLAGYLLSTNRV